jgi:hypothetical protein
MDFMVGLGMVAGRYFRLCGQPRTKRNQKPNGAWDGSLG